MTPRVQVESLPMDATVLDLVELTRQDRVLPVPACTRAISTTCAGSCT